MIVRVGLESSLRSPSYFETARAAHSITSATCLGCDTSTQWLAPATSTVWLPAHLAYQRSKSGLMVRSLPARYKCNRVANTITLNPRHLLKKIVPTILMCRRFRENQSERGGKGF